MQTKRLEALIAGKIRDELETFGILAKRVRMSNKKLAQYHRDKERTAAQRDTDSKA